MPNARSQGFLEGNEQLLRSLDETYKDFEKTVSQYHGKFLTQMNNYWRHFSCIWQDLYHQQGWSMSGPVRKRRLHRMLASLRGHVNAGPAIHFSSPIFSEPNISFAFPAEASTYTTAYGFKFCSAWPDMWSPMSTGHYSSELSETLLTLRLTPHLTHFVDVGANIGFFSLLVANESSSRVKVVAFEPFSQNLSVFRKAIAVNGFDKAITILPKALGNVTGVAELKLCKLGSGGHTLSNETAEDNFDGHEKVEVLRLEDIYRDFIPQGAKTLVKMDVESAEYDVLCGSKKWLLDKDAPIILLEAWPIYLKSMKKYNHTLVLDMLKKYGYRLFKVEELTNGESPITEITNTKFFRLPRQANYLAIPAWAASLIDRLQAVADPRVFSGRASIESMHSFLAGSSASLKKFIASEGKDC